VPGWVVTPEITPTALSSMVPGASDPLTTSNVATLGIPCVFGAIVNCDPTVEN
jgi:hypothetical protein